MKHHVKKLKARIKAHMKRHHKPKRRLFLRTAAAGAVALPSAAALASMSMGPSGAAAGGSSTRGRFPNVLLTTHEGKRVRFYDDVIQGNKLVVMNLMYTQCPEVCGGTVVNLARVQEELGARMGREVHFYSLTLDPRHDTPAVLARYRELVGAGPNWTFLTGRHADIERIRRALGWVDRDPAVDRDRTQHTGMLRIGTDALDRWLACPGLLPAGQLAREVVWVGIAQPQPLAA